MIIRVIKNNKENSQSCCHIWYHFFQHYLSTSKQLVEFSVNS
jgi:hypothetical protein